VPDSAILLAAQIERARRFYGPLFEMRYDKPEMRRGVLDQLEVLAHGASNRASFLAELTLDPPVSTGDLCGPPLTGLERVETSSLDRARVHPGRHD
jgi:hypothetical protein